MSSTTANKKTYRVALLEIRDQYQTSGEPWPARARDIARWAIAKKLWSPPRELVENKATRDFADALGEEKHYDPQGRQVKTNVAAKLPYIDKHGEKQQGWFWDDIRTASKDHLLESFKQQRTQLVGGGQSLQNQVDSANDNNPNLRGRPIKMLWDLTEEIVHPARELFDGDSA
ncbi:hypothetical protein LCGC14_1024790 [marine sediment metagenome]|uniref:Uncharacterized protein n=1 Tax=marine sediment metagenome TaxID=412755 RepID=A0A0F9R280_9ZZZZ